ncbi:CrpP-related protein [Achromobacter sp. SIMBA_011]|uniref:CrpP-related protein n=1 Tax=Achromobacter TaxID=222 RepID=UPI000AF73867|nr:CrpP-related protein [Achromobacter dolens]CAB3700784.1 hypothetical protein LMG26840_05308 [Achromobacter dolens]
MYEDIRRLGAAAAMQGAWKLDCPYFKLESLPSRTREPIGQWLEKVRAWEGGWQDQQRLRPRL